MSTLVGTDGNDLLRGTPQDDTFDGRGGFDTAQIASLSANAVFSLDAQGRWVVTSGQGADTLQRMEAVQFLGDTVTLGGEFRVNTFTAGNQADPVIAPLADGGFVVAWTSDGQDGSDSGIYSQGFDAKGVPVGPETRVNTTTAGSQTVPAVTALADGGHVIVWRSSAQNDSISDIHSQRFDASGAAVGGETRVNTTLEASHNEPSVTALSDGGYVVAWWWYDDAGRTSPAIHTQRFDPNGAPVGSEFRIVNTWGSQFQPAVAGLQDGGHVVAWMSINTPPDDSGPGIFSQRFDAAGAPVGGETLVNTLTLQSQMAPAIAALKDGGYVVTWASAAGDGSGWGIRAQRYDASGARVGGETPVNANPEGEQLSPAIAALPDGGYLVSWMSDSQDASGYGIQARRFDAQGNAVGGDLQVNSTTAADQTSPAVTALDDGGYAVAWMSYGQDGSGQGVYAQRFDGSDTPLSSGASLRGDGQANTLHFSGSRAVELYGLDGDDTLQGGGNDDVLNGGPGLDTAVVADRHTLLAWQLGAEGTLRLRSPDGGSDVLVSVEQVQAEGARIGVQGAEGRELRVNTTAQGNQANSAVTPLNDGGYLVTWNSDDGSQEGVYAQRFDASGAPAGSETRVNTSVANAQFGSVSAALNNGGYVVAWSSYLQDGSGYGVYAQRFDDSGTPVGGETQVNTLAAGDQLAPVVTALDSGGYVVAWTSQDSGGGFGVRAQRFDDSGARLGGETRVNTLPSTWQPQAAITALNDGGYVVAWMSVEEKAIGENVYAIGEIHAQRFDAAGLAVGGEIRVSSTPQFNEYNPALTALQDGGFVVAWASTAQANGDWDILARRFDAAGAAVDGDTRVNTITAGNQELPHMAALGDGGYVVTWSSDDGSGLGVFAQRFDAAGGRVGGELRVNTTTQGFQQPGGLAALDDGGYVVAWTSEDQPNNGDIFTQRFDANNLREGHLVLTGGAEDNVLRMTSSPEGVELSGGAGRDTLAGASGWDVLAGGPGADTFEFAASGNGVDTITDWGAGDRIQVAGARFKGHAAPGDGASVMQDQVQVQISHGVTTLFIGTDASAGADVVVKLDGSWAPESFGLEGCAIVSLTGSQRIIIGTAGPDRLNGTDGPDTMYGLAGKDRLVGRGGDDWLDGGAGRDDMRGGAGNDRYVVDSRKDRVIERAGEGCDTVISTVSYQLGKHVENLVLAGTNAIDGAGNALDNQITGNAAANRLSGGAGNDLLDGAGGPDVFVFDTAPGARNVDTLTGFSSADDTIALDRSVFRALAARGPLNADAFHLGAQALDSADRLVYDPGSGALVYDADGCGQAPGVQIATLVGLQGELSALNFTVF